MKKTYLTAYIALLSGSLMAQTVVTVNGTTIDSTTVDTVIKNLQEQNKGQLSDSPELRNEITRRLAVSTVVAQEAKKLKLDQGTEFKQTMEQARAAAKKEGADKKSSFKQEWALYETDLLNQAYFADLTEKNPVSEPDLKKAYGELSNYYQNTQEIQLGEIVTNNGDDAKKAITDLKAKKSFKEVAAKYSADPKAKQSGGIATAYLPLKDLQKINPSVYQAVSGLQKGAYTEPPLQDSNGVYAIFYINDKRNVTVPSFEQIKPRLTGQLQENRIAQAVEGLMQKAKIQPVK